jgi:hypothetical protein
MPLCKKCNHPHGWYNGLCAACAAAEGVLEEPGEVAGVRPIEEEGLINLEIMPVSEPGSTSFTLGDAGLDEGGTVVTEPQPEPAPVEEEKVEPEPTKTRRRRRSAK